MESQDGQSQDNPSQNEDDKKETLKDRLLRYVAAVLPTFMYFMDTGLDSSSSYDFCTTGQTWWCALSAGFIIMPELVVSAYIAKKIWEDRKKQREDKKNNKNDAKMEDFAIIPDNVSPTIAVIFFIFVPTMLLPFVMLPWLSYKALQTPEKSAKFDAKLLIRKTQITMLKLKGFEAILQACPQLSLKSYIVVHKLHCMGDYGNATTPNMTALDENSQVNTDYCSDMWDMEDKSRDVGSLEIFSMFQSLSSLCFSIAWLAVDENEDDWYRKIIWFLVLLGSIGSRMMVCDVLASWNQALWFAPPVTACIIVVVLQIIKTKEFDLRKSFRVVMEEGLLLSYPSIGGILACASYIGWAIWFYVYGVVIECSADKGLGMEALSTSIVAQGLCMVIAYIACNIGNGYDTPDVLRLMPKKRNKDDAGTLPTKVEEENGGTDL